MTPVIARSSEATRARPGFAPAPIASADRVPPSIRRLVREQRTEIKDIVNLAGFVGDARGRARATSEAKLLEEEISEIEAGLQPTADSARIDEMVDKLERLSRRVEILHDALLLAAGPTTAIGVESSDAPKK